jgi:hypothetical protein
MKRTYYPSKTFDDDLDAFVQLAKAENWYFSGIDIEKIADDAVAQRSERAHHDAIEAQFHKLHETFGLAQQARHQRFSAALNAARGAFRNNKAMLAQLEQFRHTGRRGARVALAKPKAA